MKYQISRYPWFLTGWAEGTEIEFRIDTGCQVTILAMSVIQRMCVAKTLVSSAGSALVAGDWCRPTRLHWWSEVSCVCLLLFRDNSVTCRWSSLI